MLDEQKFIEVISTFKANPFDNRKNTDLIASLGIPESTFYKNLHRLHDEINEAVERKRKKFHSDIRTAAYNALAKRLEKSDKAIELALKVMGDLIERSQTVVDMLTPEQKRAKLTALLSEATAKGLIKNDPKSTGSSNTNTPQ